MVASVGKSFFFFLAECVSLPQPAQKNDCLSRISPDQVNFYHLLLCQVKQTINIHFWELPNETFTYSELIIYRSQLLSHKL